MNNSHLNHSALEDYLQTLNHRFIDIARLTYDQSYEEFVGGYSEVKVATLDSGTPTAKLVAAKRLRLGKRGAEPKRLAFRLARELKVWAGLQHPHILPLHGFYLASDYKSAVLISEYMGCGNLHDHLEIRRPPFEERLRLVRDLTDGLVYLHTRHAPIRHGDLKPGNILVNLDRRALLADFGLSKALDAGPVGFTTGNEVKYTTRYSSPEVLFQETGTELLPNDMWSWGCLASEALTDTIPFAEIRSDPRLVLALSTGTLPYNAENLSLCPQQLGDLLVKCWSHQPEQRPTAIDCLGIVESTLLGGKASPSLSATERSVLARQESMQRLVELKRAREARNAVAPTKLLPMTPTPGSAPYPRSPNPAVLAAAAGAVAELSRAVRSGGQTVAKIDLRTCIPSESIASGQVVVAQADHAAAAAATVPLQPATEETHSPKQAARIGKVSSETGPSNFVPDPSVGPNPAVKPMDTTEPLEPLDGSRLRIRKRAPTPAWVVPPHVLLVDDDQVNRKILSKLLQVSGCTIDFAVDGIGAVNKVELEKYDLILMDIVMPKLDGFSATSLIRQFDHLTPIIAMTSNDEPNEDTAYYSNGMNDVLPKPFTRDSLFTMLQKHLMHLKVITMAGPIAEEPVKALSEDHESSMPNVLGVEPDRTDSIPPLAPTAGIINVMTNPPRSEKRALEVVDDGREGKRPRVEVVE